MIAPSHGVILCLMGFSLTFISTGLFLSLNQQYSTDSVRDMSIFISIAAYRDPQLLPTIKDCLAKARHPKELHFGICWQHDSEEKLDTVAIDPPIRILDVDWRQSEGACWARAEILKFYGGEEFFLQLDSHHRFVKDWDIKLVRHAERTSSNKPILTTYGTPFSPWDHQALSSEPMQMNLAHFTEEGIVSVHPGPIPNWRYLTRPIRARFLSAHFLFTSGDFVSEVPYDRDLYFEGEEITLAIRSFTRGYDLFHPPEAIVWHEYTRQNRRKHWDDHIKAHGVTREWHERDGDSKRKIKHFLTAPSVGPFECGPVRTFQDYETYAGLNFRSKKAQEYTMHGGEPPNPPCASDWAERTRKWQVRIELDRAMLSGCADDPYFWYVGIHDQNGEEIHRRDVSVQDLSNLLCGGASSVTIEREFESMREPLTWTVWPYSHSRGWLDKITGQVNKLKTHAH